MVLPILQAPCFVNATRRHPFILSQCHFPLLTNLQLSLLKASHNIASLGWEYAHTNLLCHGSFTLVIHIGVRAHGNRQAAMMNKNPLYMFRPAVEPAPNLQDCENGITSLATARGNNPG